MKFSYLLLCLVALVLLIVPVSAVTWEWGGGCWTATDGAYNLTKWTTTGIDRYTIPTGVTSIEYIVVAGAGSGGGGYYSGGGGAGGIVNGTLPVTAGAVVNVTVGAGAEAVTGNGVHGLTGENSNFSFVRADGGGGGGNYGGGSGVAYTGGSAGGSGCSNYAMNAPIRPPEQGSWGGGSSDDSGGGGGGAADSGKKGGSATPGAGGAGLTSAITGVSVTYATGGTGYNNGTVVNGAANTGNGGTAAASSGGTSGAGGSGIVVIKYLTPSVKPVVQFTISNVSGTAPYITNFTDTSLNTPTAWNWTANSTVNNTEFILASTQYRTQWFTEVGNYSIMLNVSNAGGYNKSTLYLSSHWVNVSAAAPSVLAPIINWSVSPVTVLFPGRVTFNDTSLYDGTHNPTAWNYTPGDGNVNVSLNARNMSYQYYKRGLWNATLNVSNSAGYNITYQWIRVIGYQG